MNNHRKQIQIRFEENVLFADLCNNQISQDFIKLLPVSLTLNDLFGREKYGRLPIALSETTDQIQTFEIGYITYWSPGPGLSIFYGQGKVPVNSGLYLLGKLDANFQLLNLPKSLKVTIEISDTNLNQPTNENK